MPGGNWSSYPPHKHDEDRPGEAVSRRSTTSRWRGDPQARPGPGGYQRVYCIGPDRPIDVLAEVKTGDVVLIPHGYHGPTMARPARPLLPQRPGRARHAAVHGILRRPATRLDPPLVARTSDRPTAAHVVDPKDPCETDRRPDDGSLPRGPGVERDGDEQRFFAGCLRHLWSRQRRRTRPGPARERRRPPLLPRAQRAGDGPHRGGLRADERPAARLRLHHLDRSRGDNLVTGAAVQRPTAFPCCCCQAMSSPPAGANPVLQEFEDPERRFSVNDCLRPVSRYFDRVWRPEQLPQALLNAMRVSPTRPRRAR